MHVLSEMQEFDPIELRRVRAASETIDLHPHAEFGPDLL